MSDLQQTPKKKTMGMLMLSMISVAAVLSVRNYPSMADEGWQLITWYFIGSFLFLSPLPWYQPNWPPPGPVMGVFIHGLRKHLIQEPGLCLYGQLWLRYSLVSDGTLFYCGFGCLYFQSRPARPYPWITEPGFSGHRDAGRMAGIDPVQFPCSGHRSKIKLYRNAPGCDHPFSRTDSSLVWHGSSPGGQASYHPLPGRASSRN